MVAIGGDRPGLRQLSQRLGGREEGALLVPWAGVLGALLAAAACREAGPSSCLPGAQESGVWGRPSISSRTGTPVYILGRERTCGPCTPETRGQARGSRTAPGDRPDPAHSSTGPGPAAASWGKIYLQVSAGPRSGRGLMGAAGASAKPWGPEDRPGDPRGDPMSLGPAPPPPSPHPQGAPGA